MSDLQRPLDLDSVPRLRDDGPTVVAIGGGHGLSMVLEAARSYAGRAIGVVTVADDGGSSGRLTSTIDIPPPGDMRRCLLALAPDDSIARRIFGYRFSDTDVAGHSMGNLMLASLTKMTGDFEQALVLAGEMLGARGRIIPVATHSLELRAEVAGDRVRGQVAVASAIGPVTDLQLEPTPEANPRAVAAIEAADQIIIGPGSLYTSVLSCVIVPGIAAAIDRSDAELVLALNLMTQDAETLGMSGHAHVETFVEFSGISRGGTVIANSAEFSVPPPVEPLHIDVAVCADLGFELHAHDLLDSGAEWPQHDRRALSEALRQTSYRRAR